MQKGITMDIHTDPTKRHEFVLLFDAKNSNPNGDPDAGNLPRVIPQTGCGLVTDVALKRKIRNYVQFTRGDEPGFRIFVQSQTALNNLIEQAFREVGADLPATGLTPEELDDEALLSRLESLGDEGFSVEGDRLVYSGDARRSVQIRRAIEGENEFDDSASRKRVAEIAQRLANEVGGGRGVNRADRERAREQLVRDYFDIRMFGAVLQTGLNAGQVRGPVQITFAESRDPVSTMDCAITAPARTRSDWERNPNTMARKAVVTYGLYRCHGFFSPFLARQLTVTPDDLEVLWEAVASIFKFDQSASRPEMTVRGLWVFSHEDEKGAAPHHKLFDLIAVDKLEGVKQPARFEDYEKIRAPAPGALDAHGFPGVTLTRLEG